MDSTVQAKLGDDEDERTISFTHSERTVKKYTDEDVMRAVRARIPNGLQICVNAIPRYSGSVYTLVELNKLVDKIVDDSLFYGGLWF